MTSQQIHCVDISIYLVVLATLISGISEAAEYCDKETFQAECAANQVVIIEDASYGRMRKGKCLDGAGMMNCQQSTIQLLHELCSGRKSCQIEVSDIGKISDPCPKDYTSYLDAEYKCEDLMVGKLSECTLTHQMLLTSTTGLLPSLAYTTRMGIQTCPWIIQAKPGQQIQLNISVYNRSKAVDEGQCPYSVQLKDTGEHNWRKKEVCGYSWTQTHLHTSHKHTLEVFNAAAIPTLENAPVYILHYQMIGCADILATSYSSVIRKGNELEVRCNRTKETWFLTCKGNEWKGGMGDCSAPPKADSSSSATSEFPYPQGLILAVVLGLVLGILIGFTSLGIYVLHRRRKLQHGMSYPHQPHSLQYEPGKEPQYGEVPLYRESGSLSTYYGDSDNPPAYGGSSLKRPTHLCEQGPINSGPLPDSGGGGNVMGGGHKLAVQGDQHHQAFIPAGGRRDML